MPPVKTCPFEFELLVCFFESELLLLFCALLLLFCALLLLLCALLTDFGAALVEGAALLFGANMADVVVGAEDLEEAATLTSWTAPLLLLLLLLPLLLPELALEVPDCV